MATNLDLQEQEQIDELKAFWKQYGNLITWTITLVLAAFAAWNGWNWWQREQAAKASVMFEALDRAIEAGDTDKAARLFGDIRQNYPRTALAQQGGLLTARLQADKGQAEAARSTLAWLAEQASDEDYRALARLRLAGLLLDQKSYDDALKQLDGIKSADYAALVADRRGDILLAQGKKAEALQAWQTAWKAMDATLDYRRVVEAKLTAQGQPPEAATGVTQ